MAQTLDDRLAAATRKRNDLDAQKQRIAGKLEAARKALADVEAECREKGIDPDKLPETIKKLSERYEAMITKLEQEVETAEAALAPYLKES